MSHHSRLTNLELSFSSNSQNFLLITEFRSWEVALFPRRPVDGQYAAHVGATGCPKKVIRKGSLFLGRPVEFLVLKMGHMSVCLVWWESSHLPGPSCEAVSLQTMNGCGGPSGGRLTLGMPSEQSTDNFLPGVPCCDSSMAAVSTVWVLGTEAEYWDWVLRLSNEYWDWVLRLSTEYWRLRLRLSTEYWDLDWVLRLSTETEY